MDGRHEPPWLVPVSPRRSPAVASPPSSRSRLRPTPPPKIGYKVSAFATRTAGLGPRGASHTADHRIGRVHTGIVEAVRVRANLPMPVEERNPDGSRLIYSMSDLREVRPPGTELK